MASCLQPAQGERPRGTHGIPHPQYGEARAALVWDRGVPILLVGEMNVFSQCILMKAECSGFTDSRGSLNSRDVSVICE